ncbi:MAG: type II toxin-antitoxin system Phd/YefM family antitoxin [Candidatus Anammoxibacter sp.]
MKTMPASEAKTNFGALIDSAQREPITISKKGRPVAVMMSMQEYEEHEALKLENLRVEIRKGIDQLDKGKSADGQVFMKSLLEELG